MKEPLRELLDELKSGLIRIYGDFLKGMYIFGSYARGDQDNESDVDVMIVLKEIGHYGTEIDRVSELASQLSLKYGITISNIFVSEYEWLRADTPLLRNVRQEAVPS